MRGRTLQTFPRHRPKIPVREFALIHGVLLCTLGDSGGIGRTPNRGVRISGRRDAVGFQRIGPCPRLPTYPRRTPRTTAPSSGVSKASCTATTVRRSNGSKVWFKAGKQHRLDGPAVEHPDGTKEWWVEGALHREDGPAIIEADGTQEWFINGQCHREDGPAVVRYDGQKQWWINGVRHREDGPAVIDEGEMSQWWTNGALHREDGPAIEYEDGSKDWFLLGQEVTEEVVMDAARREEFVRKHRSPD